MFEVPSRNTSDGTSFGVKQSVRQEAVELSGLSESSARIPPYPALT
ncbi:MAG TPA: hypothetical protein VJ746_17975 [Nitrospira sp.]|nr:hypothetical protein [Nitrospira sp.]